MRSGVFLLSGSSNEMIVHVTGHKWRIYFLLFVLSIFLIFSNITKEKAMAPHSSTLAWKIPWTEGPGRLQSMESRRVRHD